jgi:hypothetical protein
MSSTREKEKDRDTMNFCPRGKFFVYKSSFLVLIDIKGGK